MSERMSYVQETTVTTFMLMTGGAFNRLLGDIGRQMSMLERIMPTWTVISESGTDVTTRVLWCADFGVWHSYRKWQDLRDQVLEMRRRHLEHAKSHHFYKTVSLDDVDPSR